MPGRLCGLGVGPGDPELLTLKALRQLRSALGWSAICLQRLPGRKDR
jgi:precorrin-2 methylase